MEMVVNPRRFELLSSEPESEILSIELRVRKIGLCYSSDSEREDTKKIGIILLLE